MIPVAVPVLLVVHVRDVPGSDALRDRREHAVVVDDPCAVHAVLVVRTAPGCLLVTMLTVVELYGRAQVGPFRQPATQ